MALGGFFGGNLGAAAGGALQGQADYQTTQANQLRLQQMREQQVKEAAAANAQRAATEAFQKTMQSAFGTPGQPQAPAPGAPSVPMAQPPQLPPYRALQPAGQPAPMPGQVVLPQRPQPAPQQQGAPARQGLTMQDVVANAPSDPDAYRAYMEQMSPYLAAQDKSAMAQAKLELDMTKAQNAFLLAQDRLANAITPEERRQARADMNAYRKEMADTARERADTQREAAAAKVTKGSEKKQESESARKDAAQLVERLKLMIAQHPEVVGIRGSLQRGAEAVTGAFGGQGTVAHDFQQQIRMLQNIVKKIEPYGPEGRVLKGELADRDQIVQGLGSFTSPANAMSALTTLEGFIARTASQPESAATAARPVPKDRNQVIKDILTANKMDPSDPDDVKRATEFAKSEGLIK